MWHAHLGSAASNKPTRFVAAQELGLDSSDSADAEETQKLVMGPALPSEGDEDEEYEEDEEVNSSSTTSAIGPALPEKVPTHRCDV